MKKMFFDRVSYRNIRMTYVIQVLVFKTFGLFKTYGKSFLPLIKRELKKMTRDLINDFMIVYDRELWPPDRKDSFEKICKIYIKFDGSPGTHIFEFDFNKTIFEGVSLFDHEYGFVGINVFDVEYEKKLNKKEE